MREGEAVDVWVGDSAAEWRMPWEAGLRYLVVEAEEEKEALERQATHEQSTADPSIFHFHHSYDTPYGEKKQQKRWRRWNGGDRDGLYCWIPFVQRGLLPFGEVSLLSYFPVKRSKRDPSRRKPKTCPSHLFSLLPPPPSSPLDNGEKVEQTEITEMGTSTKAWKGNEGCTDEGAKDVAAGRTVAHDTLIVITDAIAAGHEGKREKKAK